MTTGPINRLRCHNCHRPLRLAFTSASHPQALNQATQSKLVGSFFNRHAVNRLPCGKIGLRLLVSVRFQILFHRPPGLLFTFPSRYLFTIDHGTCLDLRHSRRRFIRAFTSPILLTRIRHEVAGNFTNRAITVFGSPFQMITLLPTFYDFIGLKRVTHANFVQPLIAQRLLPLPFTCGINIATHAQCERTHNRFSLLPFRSPLLRE